MQMRIHQCASSVEGHVVSASLDIFPSTLMTPAAGDLTSGLQDMLHVQAGSALVRAAFEEQGARELSPLIELLHERPGRCIPARSSDPALPLSMRGNDYGWISLDARTIGFDFYYSDEDPGFVKDRVLADIAPRGARQPGLAGYPFEAAAQTGRCWTMRLQATQPLATRLLAGFAAATLASLTAGFLWSGDGAADHTRMPASPATFLCWYPAWTAGQMAR
jgi:hypothetical protein